jgi:hypothetical protein
MKAVASAARTAWTAMYVVYVVMSCRSIYEFCRSYADITKYRRVGNGGGV